VRNVVMGVYRSRAKDWAWFLVNAEPRLAADSSVSEVVCSFTDITERKRAEEELRASEERFRNAFAHAATGMALTDLGGRFLEVNQAFCQITGYTERELVARDFPSITHADDLPRNMDLMRQLLAGTVPSYVIEKRYIHKQGGVVWVRISVSLHRDSRHQPQHMIALVEDITERKQAEESLRELSGRVLQLQDEERRRLARELHDSTAQNIVALGVNLGIDHTFNEETWGPDSARSRTGNLFWTFSLQPSLKRYMFVRDPVSPFLSMAFKGSYGWNESGPYRRFTRSAKLSAGLGADWAPLRDVTIGGSAGLEWTEGMSQTNDSEATKDKISIFGTRTGSLTLHLYF